MLFIKLSLKKKKKQNQAASNRRRVPTSSLLTCSCTESDLLPPPLPAGARPPCLVRSCAASVLVLLVTFDLWVSLVSVFLCLLLGLVVFCFCRLAGQGLGCRAGSAPVVGEGLCPPARPPQASRRSHPCCPWLRMCVSGLGWSSPRAGETGSYPGAPLAASVPPPLALGGGFADQGVNVGAHGATATLPAPRRLPSGVQSACLAPAADPSFVPLGFSWASAGAAQGPLFPRTVCVLRGGAS